MIFVVSNILILVGQNMLHYWWKPHPNVALPKQETLHISYRIVQSYLLYNTHKMYSILMLLVFFNIHVVCQLSGLFADHEMCDARNHTPHQRWEEKTLRNLSKSVHSTPKGVNEKTSKIIFSLSILVECSTSKSSTGALCSRERSFSCREPKDLWETSYQFFSESPVSNTRWATFFWKSVYFRWNMRHPLESTNGDQIPYRASAYSYP